MLIGAEPGSLRLIFAAAREEARKAPIATGLRLGGAAMAFAVAARRIASVLLAMGLAHPEQVSGGRPGDLGTEVDVHSKDLENCSRFFYQIRLIEKGRIVIRVADAPSLVLVDATTAPIQSDLGPPVESNLKFMAPNTELTKRDVEEIRKDADVFHVQTGGRNRDGATLVDITLRPDIAAADADAAWHRILREKASGWTIVR